MYIVHQSQECLFSFPVSDVDFMPLSDNIITFTVGQPSDCRVIFTVSDEECEFSECSYEHFLYSLTTSNHRVNVEPSQATIFIEDTTQNCSELNNGFVDSVFQYSGLQKINVFNRNRLCVHV